MQEIQNIIEKIERMVLSAILFSPDKFDEICEVLTYTDFLFPLHSCMFHACEILYKTNTIYWSRRFLCAVMSLYDMGVSIHIAWTSYACRSCIYNAIVILKIRIYRITDHLQKWIIEKAITAKSNSIKCACFFENKNPF